MQALEHTSKLSTTMMALSAYSLDITFRSLLPAGSPSWSVLFQQRGFYSASWDWTFPCVWGYPHSNCYTLWALRPRPDQLMVWTASSLVSVCGICCLQTKTHRSPHHHTQFSCSLWKLKPSCYMLLSSAISLCFCPQLIMNSDSLITVKCWQSWGVKDYWVKFPNLHVGERQQDNGLCSQCASNWKLKEV